jgi:hypothetical protein
MKKLELFVLSIGVINILTGKTQYDWSIYEQPNGFVSLTSQGFLLFGAGPLETGSEYSMKNNDSHRSCGAGKIVDSAPCETEAVLSMLKKNGYDYYPLRPFAKRSSSRKLKTSYSIK